MEESRVEYCLEEIYSICCNKNLPFVFYRDRLEKDKHAVIQLSHEVKTVNSVTMLQKKSFVLSPFFTTEQCPVLVIEPDIILSEKYFSGEITEKLSAVEKKGFDNTETIIAEETEKEEFISQVTQLKKVIDSGELQKVVLSRNKIVKAGNDFEPYKVFDALCEKYPDAFVYLIKIQGKAFWIGATPELLLKNIGNKYHTVSLAGTKTFAGGDTKDIVWGDKEKIEQQLVTAYIEDTLSAHSISDITKEGPFTEKAGNLVHLKTSFSFGNGGGNFSVGLFIESLHPSTSICGVPKETALKYISSLEKHKRDYYAGFLGFFDPRGDSLLYVNIRCMQILKEKVVLYAGSGITNDSDPEKEWEETCNKTETVLGVVEKFHISKMQNI